jgi:hypothetical protein
MSNNKKQQGQQGQQSPSRDRDPHKAITQPVNQPDEPRRRDDRADNPPSPTRRDGQQMNQGPGKQRRGQDDGFNRNPNRRDEESRDLPNDDDELSVERQERERH